MVEHPPPQKSDEQDPLLKMESGGGDSGRAPAQPNTPRLNVACTPRKSWIDRWPELFSACWMSGMLLGVLFLIIYGLGSMGVIRRPPRYAMTCNESEPANEVYYHYLIEDGVDVPFKKLSKYLTYMGKQYPNLHFNVVFLASSINRYRRSRSSLSVQDENNMRELRTLCDFHLNYHNINVTVMPLTKYLAMTPWRYKWKRIPIPYLLFYLRVFTVWKNGGISMRLGKFGDTYVNQQMKSSAIKTILKQHNDGVPAEDPVYTSLTKVDRDEQNEFLALFFGMVHTILNETRSFLNRSFAFSEDHSSINPLHPIVRAEINKREVPDNNKNTSDHMEKDVVTSTVEHVNTTNVTMPDAAYRDTNHALDINPASLLLTWLGKMQPSFNSNATDRYRYTVDAPKQVNSSETNRTPVENDLAVPPVLILYDFSIVQDIEAPRFALPNKNCEEEDGAPTGRPIKKAPTRKVSITFEGSFVAATTREHPFLGRIITKACQGMSPGFAIQNAYIEQCSPLFYEDNYCNNIFII